MLHQDEVAAAVGTVEAGAVGDDQPRPDHRPRRERRAVRTVAMRPRRVLVKVHRWLALVLLAWLVVVAITGGWLVVHHAIARVLHGDRFTAHSGDVGPDAAVDAARAAFPAEAEIYWVTLPPNGRGVYQVEAEVHLETETEVPEGVEPPHDYFTAFVDPGTGTVNGVTNDEEGLSWWLYRGHMYLWQDWGLFGVHDPESGWCRRSAEGAEPGGVKGVVCDVIPDGMDSVGWLGVGFVVVLLSGFYLWYWPGVRRWATALAIRRRRGAFTFNLSLHKVIGFVVWIPLTVVAFTGIAFAFPNLNSWYENATPSPRDFSLWTTPEAAYTSVESDGVPLTWDGALAAMEDRFPDRAVNSLMPPADETGTYSAWVTRGFDPWTREGGAGNTLVVFDQHTGEVLYDGTPEEGNVFDQAWDDWSFPLHTGDFLGTTSRVLWVGLALSPIALGVTGVVMNRIRASKRKRRRHRDPSSTDAPVAVS